jgi:PAS domain S-box-containing protein
MLEDLENARKKIEQAHQEWMAALDVVDDPIFLHDKEFRILRCNKAYRQRAGIPFSEIIGRPYYEIFPKTGAPLPCCLRAMEKAEEEEEVTVGEMIYRSRSFSVHDEQGGHLYSVHILEDITAHKRAEVSLAHANRALAALGAVNRSLVHVDDEMELLQSICRVIVEQRGYRMAWVGYAQHDEEKSIKVMAHAGHEQGYFDAVRPTWVEDEYGMVPSGRAIRSGKTQLCQDIANDPAYRSWRDAALGRGYLSSVALPLANGEAFGVLAVYAEEANAFTHGEVYLLEEMADDLAFGVRSLHARRERDAALEQNRRQLAQLQGNLDDTVRAIARIVEMRDPYTAGHQASVADLAAAIAKQMGLPDEQVHGIHLAGVLHDLGKIQIPAEILSKPGRLNDIEYSLIKYHPQAGYDILKGIDFPWPVAQMVLQHHERLDGSGYPQGLKGEQIIPEARILCVADVVEAISAHRPYRPGFGVDAALEEITGQRGILYDPQVVDACLTLFREKGYKFG